MVLKPKLLVAITAFVVLLYVVLVIFSRGGGNGGEYWGFDGRIEPVQAAMEAFEAERYQFLSLHMPRQTGVFVTVSPQPLECSSTSERFITEVHRNSDERMHGPESAELAEAFARAFNDRMDRLIRGKLGFRCELRID